MPLFFPVWVHMLFASSRDEQDYNQDPESATRMVGGAVCIFAALLRCFSRDPPLLSHDRSFLFARAPHSGVHSGVNSVRWIILALKLAKAAPTLILPAAFSSRPFVVLEPEAIPIQIPLKGGQASLWMLWLMIFIGVIEEFHRFFHVAQPGKHLKTFGQGKWTIFPVWGVTIAHPLH